tara:strand:+ start:503 stop:1501 length:999 start_codon:yes stop_codon:yes gene_type:complete
MFKGKTILVTGGTGSFGKAFTEHLIKFHSNFKKLIVFSRDELKQSEMIQDKKFDHHNIRFILGDIRDYSDIRRATQNVDIIIHAAALKQVPTAEYNPFQFIKTNILGSQNIIEAALDTNVKNVVALSTDKASSPINLYGATKLCSEKLFIAANNIKGKKNISFSVVRYGNVMGSRGSVIPLFLKFNKNNKQLTLTDKEMTRFNITLKESIELVLSSLKNSREGEIFIPKIPSFHILDLIKAITPNKKYKLIGVRPGEKIHEELISVYEGKSTVEFKNYYAILPTIDQNTIKSYCNKKGCKTVVSNFSYTSANNKNFLKVSEIKKLLDVNFRD